MKLTLTATHDVQVSEEEGLRVAREALRLKFDLPEHPSIQGDQLCTSYFKDGTTQTDPVRVATPDDIAAVHIYARLI